MWIWESIQIGGMGFVLSLFIHFEREGGRENPKQALHSQHRAWCRAWTHEPWDHNLSQGQMLTWMSHPGALVVRFLKPFLVPYIKYVQIESVDSHICS